MSSIEGELKNESRRGLGTTTIVAVAVVMVGLITALALMSRSYSNAKKEAKEEREKAEKAASSSASSAASSAAAAADAAEAAQEVDTDDEEDDNGVSASNIDVSSSASGFHRYGWDTVLLQGKLASQPLSDRHGHVATVVAISHVGIHDVEGSKDDLVSLTLRFRKVGHGYGQLYGHRHKRYVRQKVVVGGKGRASDASVVLGRAKLDFVVTRVRVEDGIPSVWMSYRLKPFDRHGYHPPRKPSRPFHGLQKYYHSKDHHHPALDHHRDSHHVPGNYRHRNRDKNKY